MVPRFFFVVVVSAMVMECEPLVSPIRSQSVLYEYEYLNS